MRDILFRGKDAFGEWQYGSFSREAVEQVCGEENASCGWIRHFNFTTKSMVASKVDRETVSEFTGRRDKNGKRIYENDIVEEAGGHRSVVKYSEEEAKFVLESKYVVTELGNKQVTVIGNIFDNPELIDNA